jgi:hypothetical protein
MKCTDKIYQEYIGLYVYQYSDSRPSTCVEQYTAGIRDLVRKPFRSLSFLFKIPYFPQFVQQNHSLLATLHPKYRKCITKDGTNPPFVNSFHAYTKEFQQGEIIDTSALFTV